MLKISIRTSRRSDFRLHPDNLTYTAKTDFDKDNVYSESDAVINSGEEPTFKNSRLPRSRHLFILPYTHKRSYTILHYTHLSILAYTHKRSYTILHYTQLSIIKPLEGYRYMATRTYQDIRGLSEADLMFDRSDIFFLKLDRNHELLPISAANVLAMKPPKERAETRESIYGLND
jgi:hypothetical protein